jgi:hypothetical protein
VYIDLLLLEISKFISVLAKAKTEKKNPTETKDKVCLCSNNASYIISYLLLIIINMKEKKNMKQSV